MADREARVRLSLIAGSFLGGLQQVSSQAKAMLGTIAAASSKAAMAGVANVKTTFAEMGQGLKSSLRTAAQFGGIFGVGAAAKQGLELQETYRNLAFDIGRATNEAVRWEEVQRTIEPVALATGRTSRELAMAMRSVFEETGDVELAKKSLSAIGTIATASGRSVDELAAIAGALGDKFGVTAAEMPDALASMIELANRGGANFADLEKVIHLTGASARAAGLSGEQGVRRMIAMANLGGDALGTTKKGLMAITQLLDQMVDPNIAKQIKQNFGVGVLDKTGAARDAADVLADIFAKTGGKREKLGVVFKGEQMKLVTELGKHFTTAFDATEGTLKQKTEAGVAAFKAALDKAGQTTFKFADAQKEAFNRVDDPKRKLNQAIETFTQEFTKPEALEAMNELAKSLPKVAQLFAKLTSFAINNPLLAGAGFVGAKVGLSFASGVLTQAGATIGTAAAVRIKAAAAATGPWKAAGAAVGIAAAAWLGFELGKSQINKAADKHRGIASGLAGATTAAEVAAMQPGASREAKEAALKTLRERIEHAEREKKETKESFLNKVTFGAAADVTETFAKKDDQLAKAHAAARELESSLSKGSKEGDKASAALQRTAKAAESAALALNKLRPPGGEGSNGLPPGAPNVPGFMPR